MLDFERRNNIGDNNLLKRHCACCHTVVDAKNLKKNLDAAAARSPR